MRVRREYVVVLAFIVISLVLFVASVYSSVKSVVERRNPRKLEFLSDELIRGAQSHLGTRDQAIPGTVLRTSQVFKQMLSRPNAALHPALWELGHAIGDECWRNGYAEGIKVGALPADRIRIELTAEELQQMSWLAHLGFQHMMPNYRGFEVHRFSGEADARAGARAVALLECALPKSQRPFSDITAQLQVRDRMIADWWVRKPEPVPA